MFLYQRDCGPKGPVNCKFVVELMVKDFVLGVGRVKGDADGFREDPNERFIYGQAVSYRILQIINVNNVNIKVLIYFFNFLPSSQLQLNPHGIVHI